MRLLFLFILLFFVISCIVPEGGNNSRFHGDRKKLTSSVERNRSGGNLKSNDGEGGAAPNSSQRANANPEAPLKEENMVFPFVFNSAHVKVHLQPAEEQKKMLLSVEPEETPVSLIAGFSGVVSITESAESRIMSISPTAGKQVVFFELSKEHTKLLVADGASVTQKAPIAESSQPILFYVKKNNQLTRLCFSVEQLPEHMSVVQDYENHPDCN